MAAAGWPGAPPGRTYAATLRVRASRPGTLVMVTLLEVAGGRRGAADTIGAVLLDRGWQRIEVAHEGQRPGAALAVEVVLPSGSPRASTLRRPAGGGPLAVARPLRGSRWPGVGKRA